MRRQLYALSLAGTTLSAVVHSPAHGADNDALIKSAMSAAPAWGGKGRHNRDFRR
jgi:hypothetical protein